MTGSEAALTVPLLLLLVLLLPLVVLLVLPLVVVLVLPPPLLLFVLPLGVLGTTTGVLPTDARFGITKNDRLLSASSPPLYRHAVEYVSYRNPQHTTLLSHFFWQSASLLPRSQLWYGCVPHLKVCAVSGFRGTPALSQEDTLSLVMAHRA